MHRCRGGKGWAGCGREVRYLPSSFTVGNVAVDPNPAADGDVVIEGGLAVVLAPGAAHEGPRYKMHIATCPRAIAAMETPVFRGRPQHTQPRPAFEMGTFETKAEMHVAQIEAGALDQEADRLTERFIEHVRSVHGDREIYVYTDIRVTFNSFRRLVGLSDRMCDLVKTRARKFINVSEADAA